MKSFPRGRITLLKYGIQAQKQASEHLVAFIRVVQLKSSWIPTVKLPSRQV